MRHHHGPHCGCPKCIVYPTKVNNVNTCSESVVEHVHPSHTNVINHHTVKNQHVFPHSTSYQNVTNSVDQMGPSFEVPAPPNQVAGAMSPGFGPGQMAPGYGAGPMPGQVAGAMSPGTMHGGNMTPGYGAGPGQVAGAMNPGPMHGGHMGPGCGNKHPNKW